MRPRDEDAAIVTDIYLDRLLATRDAALAAAGLDLPAELAEAARAIRRSLRRIGPSVHFEEHLAGRLRLAAAQPAVAGAPVARVIPFPGAAAARPDDRGGARIGHRLGLVAWGAAASAVPLVGAALIARRRGRDRRVETA